MARPSLKNRLVDFDDPMQGRRFRVATDAFRGVYKITMEPKAPTRSLRQNAYWFGVIVESLFSFLRDQEYAGIDRDYVHHILAAKLLGTADVTDPVTGEVLANYAKSTRDLNVEQFADLIDRGQVYLADVFGIAVPDPDPNWREARETAGTKA